MYEQGLPANHGTGVCRCRNGSSRESKSFLENVIGLSAIFPMACANQRAMAHDTITPEQWYAIQTAWSDRSFACQADEATYNLHIIIRFEPELKLLTGEPKWQICPKRGTKRTQLLGITPSNPNEAFYKMSTGPTDSSATSRATIQISTQPASARWKKMFRICGTALLPATSPLPWLASRKGTPTRTHSRCARHLHQCGW